MAGLLDIFGTGGTNTLGLLGMSPADIQSSRDDAQAQALYSLAGRLFQGGNTGASIAEGLQKGQQAYKSAMQGQLQEQLQSGQLQDLLRKRKMEEEAMKRKALVDQSIAASYRPATMGTPSQMVEEDGRYMGETPAVAGRAAGIDLQSLAPKLMAFPEGRAALTELLASQKAMRPETFSLAEGATQYQRDPFTNEVTQVAAGAPKTPATPADIQGYNLAKTQGFGGSFVDYQTALKKAGASSTSVSVSGDKSFATEFGKGVAANIDQGFNSAKGATETLGRIQTLKPMVTGNNVFSGPLANAQVAASRLADSLGVGGENNAEKLKNTTVAMQQLAGLELSAAEAMRGQGAITENERSLIKRAAGGDLMTMTAKEVSSLLEALEKTSNYKIGIHEKNLERLKKNKDLSGLAQYYELPKVAAPATSPLMQFDAAKEQRYQDWLKTQGGRQ